METVANKVKLLITDYGFNVLGAVLILVIGYWASKLISSIVKKLMRKSKVDETLVSFVGNLTYIALMTFVIIAAINKLGFTTTSFVAVIGAAGLAVGFALQGALANFAAGVLMIIFKPFKVDDFIEGGGVTGVVEKIEIFTTQLRTPDNKTVIVPNSKLTGDNITNYNAKGTRRVDMVIGVSYKADIDKAKAAITDVLANDERILKDPPVTVAVVELADSSVNLVVRPWTTSAEYWNVLFSTTEAIKKRLDSEGIGIPFPQRDVHIYKHDE